MPGDRTDERGLAGAVRADERDQLARGNLERNAGERLGVAVVEIEIANRQHQERPAPFDGVLAEVAVQHRRIAHDRGRRAARDHLAVVEHDDLIGERHHRAHHVLGQQDRDPLVALHAAQHRDQLVDLGRPQPRHHLVQQQQGRARRERARHLEPPAIGERQVRGGDRRLARRGPGARARRGRGRGRRRRSVRREARRRSRCRGPTAPRTA